MTEFTPEEQLYILEILYSLKHIEAARELIANMMDTSDEELFKVLDKAEVILNKQIKENPN